MNNGIQGAMQNAPDPAQADPMPPVEPQAMQPGMEPGGAPDEGVTPEEQEIYETFVSQAQMAIYTPETTTAFLKVVKAAKDPVSELGKFAANVAFRVVQAAQDSGVDIDDEIVLQGGAEIVEALVEVSEEGGGPEFEPDQIDGAFYAAADEYRSLMEGAGQINPDAAQQGMQDIAAAEQSGELEQMLQGAAPAGAQPGPPPPAGMEQA
jgi:hypothetical protein